jgi:hypothetical protein
MKNRPSSNDTILFLSRFFSYTTFIRSNKMIYYLMFRGGIIIICLWLTMLSGAERCPVHFKPAVQAVSAKYSAECVSLTSADPLLALQWLTTETSASASSPERTNTSCHIWSIRKQRLPNKCDHSDLVFETSWANTGCKVTLTYSSYISKCYRQISRAVSKLGVTLLTTLSETPTDVHLLRIHDNNLGSMPAILSELYQNTDTESSGSILRHIPFLSLDLSVRPAALQDVGAGDSSAHAWQLWSAAYLLQSENFAVSRVTPDTKEESKEMPLQYTGKKAARFHY